MSWRCPGPVFLQPAQDRLPGRCPVRVSCLSCTHCPTCKARHCQDSCWTPQPDTHPPCSRTPAGAASQDSQKSQCTTPVQDTSAALLKRRSRTTAPAAQGFRARHSAQACWPPAPSRCCRLICTDMQIISRAKPMAAHSAGSGSSLSVFQVMHTTHGST